MRGNLYNAIQSAARAAGRAVALAADHGEAFTYAEFDAWTARYAAWLRAAGVRPGQRVLVQADKSAQLLMLCYGVIRAGSVFVPINVGARKREMDSVLNDCEPALVICDPRRAPQYEALRATAGANFAIATLTPQGRGTAVEKAAQQQAPVFADDAERVGGDAPAALMYTSGTTGQAKAAIITHTNILANGEALRAHWSWSAGETLLHTLPLFHLHGLFVATMPSLLSGSKILLRRRFNARQAIAALPRASVFMGVPTYFARLLACPALSRGQCAGTRMFISGSAPLLEQVFQEFRARTGHEVLCRYGLTETGGTACNLPGAPRMQGMVGVPLPGFTVRVADGNGAEAASGVTGEILVYGPSVSPGYWKRPEETAQAFTADGFFRTGDLGRRLADGSFEIVGRVKDVIITGGANVNPREVEAALDACPGVAESAVVGVPDPEYGEAVIAFVVPQGIDGITRSKTFNFNSLLNRLKQELALYKVPRRIIVRAELPRNAMGKIQKNLLKSDPQLLGEPTTAPEHG